MVQRTMIAAGPLSLAQSPDNFVTFLWLRCLFASAAPESRRQRSDRGLRQEKGRHEARRTKLANLRPENCRADVLAL